MSRCWSLTRHSSRSPRLFFRGLAQPHASWRRTSDDSKRRPSPFMGTPAIHSNATCFNSNHDSCKLSPQPMLNIVAGTVQYDWMLSIHVNSTFSWKIILKWRVLLRRWRYSPDEFYSRSANEPTVFITLSCKNWTNNQSSLVSPMHLITLMGFTKTGITYLW